MPRGESRHRDLRRSRHDADDESRLARNSSVLRLPEYAAMVYEASEAGEHDKKGTLSRYVHGLLARLPPGQLTERDLAVIANDPSAGESTLEGLMYERLVDYGRPLSVEVVLDGEAKLFGNIIRLCGSTHKGHG